MKKLTITILCFLLCSIILAQVDNNAVTMVSFEQLAHDYTATISLKNNTKEEIQDVTFQITYLDMEGKPLDYKGFYKKVDIAPGMTKKVDIDSYERDRSYEYHKSSNYSSNPQFEVSFDLKGYNTGRREAKKLLGKNASIDGHATLDFFLLICLCGIWIGSYGLVAVVAHRRNLNAVAWFLIGLLLTPVIALMLILIVDKGHKNTDE